MAEEPRDELLRDVSSLLRQHRGPCPAVETLIAYARGELAPAEAGALSAHLQLCPSCQELAALGDEEADDEEVDEVTWKRATRGLDARAAPWRETPWQEIRGRSRRGPWAAALLAAAALPAGVGTGWWAGGGGDPGVQEDAGVRSPTTRGSALRPLEPVGAVEALSAFRWQAPPVDLEFLVRVEADGEPVWSGTSASHELAAPPELRELLEPGRSYAWRVEARDENDRVVLESGWVALSLRPAG
jgi:hypothetical protein